MPNQAFTHDQVKVILDYIDQKNDETKTYIDDKIDSKVGMLPTKEEFFNKMDQVMGELKAIREEHAAYSDIQVNHTNQLHRHSKRLEKLEKVVFTAS